MEQLTMPNMKEDILACSLRNHASLFQDLIEDLKIKNIQPKEAGRRIRQIEDGLRRLGEAE